jgi:sugar-specific transcriptional regulator TrmB
VTRNPGSLLERLVEHGIPERSARIYLAACRDGPQTASELARAGGLDRVDAYRAIRRLESAGLLRTTGGRPMRFAALPPSDLVDGWIRNSGEHLKRLQGDRDRLLAEWTEELTHPDLREARKFAVLEGRPTIQGWLRRQIGLSRREVLLAVGSATLSRAIEGGMDRPLREAHARGVRIRLVAPITAATLKDAKLFEGFAEIRHTSDVLGSRTVVVDKSVSLVYVSGEEGFGDSDGVQVALWSTAPSFVALARDYHHRLWNHAVPAPARFVQLENPPGAELTLSPANIVEPLERLREIAELGMRVTGVAQLRLDLPEMIETVARRLGLQIASKVSGSTREEVVRSLATYYREHALGNLDLASERPFTLRVTDCFACTEQSPEIGRLLCPKLLQTVLETRLGLGFEVSKPDPRRHATRGCRFTITST